MQPAGKAENDAVGPPGTPLHGPDELQRRPRGAGRDQGVGAALLRVVAGHRCDRVEQPGPQPHPRPDQPGAECGHQARGDRRRAHGRKPEDDLVGVDGEDGVHEQVVEAVHRVHPLQQPPDLRQGTARDLEGDRLVPPHPAAVETPEPEGEHHQRGHGHGDGAPGTPRDAARRIGRTRRTTRLLGRCTRRDADGRCSRPVRLRFHTRPDIHHGSNLLRLANLFRSLTAYRHGYTIPEH